MVLIGVLFALQCAFALNLLTLIVRVTCGNLKGSINSTLLLFLIVFLQVLAKMYL